MKENQASIKLPPLYVIIDADVLSGRGMSLEAFATELRLAGVSLLQYRAKSSTPQAVLRDAAVIAEVFAQSGATLIMNDRSDLAVLAGWNGVHVGHEDLSPEDAKVVFACSQNREVGPFEGGTRIVGVSTHNDAQVISAQVGAADYIATGPVFATGTKLDAAAVIGLEGVRQARVLTQKPLVAIGGITRANARSVIAAGADSIAVISGLFVAGETVEQVARDFLRLLR